MSLPPSDAPAPARAVRTVGGTGTASDALRGARVALVGSTAFALAAGAHLAAGGTLPTGLGLVALATLTLVTAALLARGPLRPTTLLPALGVLEVALHEGFDVLSAGRTGLAGALAGARGPGMAWMPGMPVPSDDGGRLDGAALVHAGAGLAHVGGLVAHPAAVASSVPGVSSMPLMAAHAGGTGVAMLVAHAVATIVTAALLVGAERAAARTLTWLGSVLPRVRAVALAVPSRRTVLPVAVAVAGPRPLLVADGGTGRRGPPRSR